MITALDALAFALLVGRGRSARANRGRCRSGSPTSRSSGPIAMYRIDGATVPLAVAGCLWLVGRPWIASALLAIATWIKVWPAALLAAAVIAVRRRGAIIGGALLVSAVTCGRSSPWAGRRTLFGFVADQTGRGLQVEAPISTFYLWRAVAGIDGSFVYYDRDLLTFQVAGPDVDTVIAVMTALLVVAVAADRRARRVQGVARARASRRCSRRCR